MDGPTPAEIQYQRDHFTETQAPPVLASCITCFTLAAVAVCLRVLSRRLVVANLGKDDYTIFAALVFALGYVCANFISIHYGGMKHAIAIEHPVEVAKLILVIEIFYSPAICCVKLSCLLLYQRLFPNRSIRYVLWFFGLFIFCYTAFQTFFPLFWCRPLRAAWDPEVKNPQCLDYNRATLINGIFNVITDFAILIIPLPILWRLNLPRNQKIQLTGVFLSGSFVCAVSIYRVPRLNLVRKDASYADATTDVWSIVEVCVGIVGACLPTMRPLLTRFSPAARHRSDSRSKLVDQESRWISQGSKQLMDSPLQVSKFKPLEVHYPHYPDEKPLPTYPAAVKVNPMS